MIEFRKLVIHHFMSYEHAVIPLANQGIIRIEGVNMAGKSTIVEALLWCLFGKTLRGLKHESIVNRRFKKNCFVSTTFTSKDTAYLCRRNRRHKKHNNKLLLYRSEDLISSRHESETQRRLENILGCDFESFVNSVVFGGFDGNRKQFALKTDTQQKQVFDSFLRFEKFDIALKRAKKALEDGREQQHRLQLKIQTQHGNVSTVQGQISTIEKSQKVLEQSSSLALRRMEKRILLYDGPSKEELKARRDEIERLVGKKAGAETKIEALQNQLRVLAKKRHHREEMIGKPCPACGRLVKETTLSSLLKHLNQDRKRLKKERDVILLDLERLERRVKDVKARLIKSEKRYHIFQSVKRQKRELESKLRDEKLRVPFSAELEKAHVQHTREVSRLLAYEYEEYLLRNRIKDLEFWEQGFGNKGIRTIVVKNVLPSMNRKLREYAEEIFDKDTEIEFRTSKQTKSGSERELFYLHYSSRRNSTSYTGESAGGRRRVDICCLLVFSWLSGTSNVLLVDELLDGLDENGRNSVLGILARHRGTVLFITHSKEIKSEIGRVWTVRKENGISTLEMG